MNSYKCMYVIPKEMYQRLKASSSTQSSLNSVSSQSQVTPTSLPPPPPGTVVCGKDFKHPNILAHHSKSHVDGFQCNICKRVLNSQQELNKHLVQHAADTAKKFDGEEEEGKALYCPICKKPSKHKRNLARHMQSHDRSSLNFIVANNKWLTLQ